MYYQQQPINQPNYLQPYLIEVSGNSEMAVNPDMGTINLGVMTENRELFQAQQQNSLNVNNVIQSLLTNGIPKEKMRTFDYRIDSEYDFVEGKQIFRGYKVTNLLQVTIDDLSLVGKIVDEAVHHGANYIANVQFSLKSQDTYYQKVLSMAIKDAVNKASTIAKNLKVHLQPTPVLVIEDARIDQPIPSLGGTYVKGISTTSFEPGQLMIKAKILAHFRYYA
ncbi:MAG: SIMPL domain-containing protein [Bacillota bacterium]|nr:SIMPL domain-containing protein [Bacillota bacterium]